jgi:hypothetical protein
VASNERLVTSGEFQSTWSEVDMASYLKALFQNLPEGTGENYETLRLSCLRTEIRTVDLPNT